MLDDEKVKIVDLAADFRLRDPAAYRQWYGHDHAAPDLLSRFAYGLPERHRKDIATAQAVAAPGCYPTAATLALAPLVDAGAIETTGVIVDAASGVSGAGRAPKPTTHFGTVNEDFVAYGLLDHRHTPEIEQATGAKVLFTPHLAPMTRGILATCYARPTRPTSTEDLLDLLHTAYAGEPFVVVSDRPPSTKATWGSNTAHLTARYDPRTGWVVVLAALDNLVKGRRARPSSAPTSSSASTRRPASPPRACTRERRRPDQWCAEQWCDRPRGLRGRRRGLRDQAERRPRPGPRRHRRRQSRCPRQPSSPPTRPPPRRCWSAGPTSPPRGARPRPSS